MLLNNFWFMKSAVIREPQKRFATNATEYYFCDIFDATLVEQINQHLTLLDPAAFLWSQLLIRVERQGCNPEELNSIAVGSRLTAAQRRPVSRYKPAGHVIIMRGLLTWARARLRLATAPISGIKVSSIVSIYWFINNTGYVTEIKLII